MSMQLQKEFVESFPSAKINEPLCNHSTLRIGGPADFFYNLKDSEKLPALIEFAQKNAIPFLILGAGTNLLFADAGFRGLIIKIETQNISRKGAEITADAGLKISKFVDFSINENLSGLEQWIALPGTVGGAVRGNAGSHGLETKDILIKAKLFNPENLQFSEVLPDFFEFDYRTSKLKKIPYILINATFKLKKRKISLEQQQKLRESFLKFRREKQPFGLTAGSFFKNPSPEFTAGMLIEQAGLKGKKIGGAQISEKHANFFMNTGTATAKDILALATLAKREVKAKFGMDIKEEVQIIPENILPK